MGRKPGAKNKDFLETRERLAREVAFKLLSCNGRQPTLKELAEGVGVDAGTLRHYFTDRKGAVQAALESLLPFGEQRLAATRELGAQPALVAMTTLLTQVSEAWEGLLGGMHAAGFSEGMLEPAIGQAYVASILEPTLSAVEALLSVFHGRGELHIANPRVAALALLGPVLLALFHQHQLSGKRCRPLEMAGFIEAHLHAFLAGHGPARR